VENLGEAADVAIVGAGLPALALAIFLQERGISTMLLDSRKSADSFPRGFTLQPNGLEVLDKLGLLDKALQTGSKAEVFEVRAWDGKILLEADYKLLDHPQNYLLTVNATDLDMVLRYKAEKSGAQFVWGTSFKDLVRNNGQLTGLKFETNGALQETNTAVVVGADGANSRVRTLIGSKAEARKYPDSFIVGLVGPVSGFQGRARQYQNPGKMLGVMPASPTVTYLFHCVGKSSFDQVKAAGMEKLKAEVNRVAPETVEALAGMETWTKLAFFTPSRVLVDRWVDNGVALLGDSAHSFHPHAGQGLNLSLQDALVLAEVIEKAVTSHDNSANFLREYETRQRMFSDVIGQHADYSARYALSSNWLIRRLNRRALNKLQKNRRLLKEALEITAGVFQKKPSLLKLARIGGLLP